MILLKLHLSLICVFVCMSSFMGQRVEAQTRNVVQSKSSPTHNWPSSPIKVNGGTIYTIVPFDTAQPMRFYFEDNANHQPLELFKKNPTFINLKAWDVPSGHSTRKLGHSELLTLLYWHASFQDSRKQEIPNSQFDSDELRDLRLAPKLLPSAAFTNMLKTDRDWYCAALEGIMSRPSPAIEEATNQSNDMRDLFSHFKQGRDLLDEAAKQYQLMADQAGNSGNLEKQKTLQYIATNLLNLKGKLLVTKNQENVSVKWAGKKYNWNIDKVLFAFQFLSTLSQKMSLSEELADNLQAQLSYAKENNIVLDFNFVSESERVIRTTGQFNYEVYYALADTAFNWLNEYAISSLQNIAPSALKELGNRLAVTLVSKFPALSGYASGVASSVASSLGGVFLGVMIADIAFNTSGIYEGIKKSEFSFKCSEQFEKIGLFAVEDLKTSSSRSGSLSAWANSTYFRELSAANYHNEYATLLSESRLSKWGADKLLKLLHRGSTNDAIEIHAKFSSVCLKNAEEWVRPKGIERLLSLRSDIPFWEPEVFKPLPLQISAPVLVIDRSGSIADKAGVMRQVQLKADEVVRAIQANVTEAAVINFSGANNSAIDAPFTKDTAVLAKAIRSPSVSNTGTAIYDAVASAVNLATSRGQRSMLILLTDGQNNQGRGLDEAIRICQEKSVPVLIVGFEGTEGRDDAKLQSFADSTGGFYVRDETAQITQLLNRFRFYSTNKQQTRPRGSAW